MDKQLDEDCRRSQSKIAAPKITCEDEKIVELTETLDRLMKQMCDVEQNEKKSYECRIDSSLNTRALSKEVATYQLEKFSKHALVIFNQKVVDGEKPRFGTENDVKSLTTTFENFGFEVTSYDYLTKDALFEKLKELGERNFTDYGCVAVAILTHGTAGGMLCAKDEHYKEIDVIDYFLNNATLTTKPKIVIIQACRGPEASPGVRVIQSDLIRKDEECSEPYYFLPLEADLLIFYSAYADRLSHRHRLEGSWFIQTLCKKINTLYSTHDLESIMTEVKRAVAIDMGYEEYNPCTLETHVFKQIPVSVSTLIRKLYLKKFKERALEEPRGSRDKVFEETDVDKSMQQRELRKKVAEVAKNLTNHLKWRS